MKVGICAGLDLAHRALAAGFDYIEVGATGFALREDFKPEEYRAARVEASNLFFPGTIRLFGAEATPYLDYAREAILRASAIGIDTMVIGSGGSRRAPEGIDGADEAFCDIVRAIANLAEPHGISVAPESLNRTETNVGNDLPTLARALQAREVGYTADSFHVLFEWQANGGTGVPNADFWREQLPHCPTHVHVGDLPRSAPEPEDPMIQGFAQRLRELGYDGRISLEAKRRDDSDAELERIAKNLRLIFG